MPKFNNEDNFIMMIKLSNELIASNKLVAYFLSAPKDAISYSFKNKLRYKVMDEMLYAKAKSSKLMLFKENGIKIDDKKLKTTSLQFRHFSIELAEDKLDKKPTFLRKLFRSFAGDSKPDFKHVSALTSVYEFEPADVTYKFNRTKFDNKNELN